MLQHLCLKRARPADDDGEPEGPSDDERARLEWELSVVRQAISEHRASSADLYGLYDQHQGAAEARLYGDEQDGIDWQSIVDQLRASRVATATERGNALRAMRRREAELEAILGEGW